MMMVMMMIIIMMIAEERIIYRAFIFHFCLLSQMHIS